MSRYLAALFMCFVLLQARPQGKPLLSEAEAREHLSTKQDPIYPPIAKAAHVQGEVVVQVEIGVDGKVTSTKALSGPEMLRGAATDAVKVWVFTPFIQNGQATAISAKLVMPFSLGEAADPADLKTAKVFFPLSDKCHKLVGQQADPAEQARACKDAADEADKFSSNARFIERRSAYVYCATALMRNKEFKDALLYGSKAVTVVLQGHDDGSGSSAAYGVKGQAEGLTGNLAAADNDLRTAEKYQRDALDTPAGKELNKEYSRGLRGLLMFHAQVLTAAGKTTDAQALRDEADKYK